MDRQVVRWIGIQGLKQFPYCHLVFIFSAGSTSAPMQLQASANTQNLPPGLRKTARNRALAEAKCGGLNVHKGHIFWKCWDAPRIGSDWVIAYWYLLTSSIWARTLIHVLSIPSIILSWLTFLNSTKLILEKPPFLAGNSHINHLTTTNASLRHETYLAMAIFWSRFIPLFGDFLKWRYPKS